MAAPSYRAILIGSQPARAKQETLEIGAPIVESAFGACLAAMAVSIHASLRRVKPYQWVHCGITKVDWFEYKSAFQNHQLTQMSWRMRFNIEGNIW
jgi:hypothetical protein